MLRCASCLVPKRSRVRNGTISAKRRHCCSQAVRGLCGRFVWRDRQSRSTEVSARLRVREKLVSRMRRSRECCHIKHVGTRNSGHSEHVFFTTSTKYYIAACSLLCPLFLRHCMRLVTMAPPIPPTSFVSQWPLGGVVDLAFCNLIDFWGRAVDRPSSNGKCSPEGCSAAEVSPSGPRRV